MTRDTHRHFIEHMRWDEVAGRLDAGASAILPIGAAAKQHGFHLPLDTDRIQAEWLADKIAETTDALVWPTLTYGHYPAFVEYAGNSNLSAATFEAVVRDIATAILAGNCRRLFVLNTGLSTLAPVDRALARLDAGRVKHLWTHGGPRYPALARALAQQGNGSHADELETSLMLVIAPGLVDMNRAEASPTLNGHSPGPLVPSDPNSPNYSRSGSYGDPTLATRAKGEQLQAAMLEDLIEQVASFAAERPAAGAGSGAAASVTG